MTFYQELQLNQAGSKNLLKKSETLKEMCIRDSDNPCFNDTQLKETFLMRRTTATTDYLKECMGTALLELMKEKPDVYKRQGLAGAVIKITGVDNNFTGTYTTGGRCRHASGLRSVYSLSLIHI